MAIDYLMRECIKDRVCNKMRQPINHMCMYSLDGSVQLESGISPRIFNSIKSPERTRPILQFNKSCEALTRDKPAMHSLAVSQ